uniref:hypothetical protein n=1 Tax=Acetatifactor sp. TaxID=1872090 RepID=UPI004055A46C
MTHTEIENKDLFLFYKNSKGYHKDYQYHNSIEIQFCKLHHYFPEQLFMMLLALGYTDKSFKFIQLEMDRLFTLQKIESEFTPLENFKGEAPF